MSENLIATIFKRIFKAIVNLVKQIVKLAAIIAIAFIIITVLFIIIFLSSSWDIKNKYGGACIEADEFGIKGNIIKAYAENDSQIIFDYSSTYKHESMMQKIQQTDLGLTLNGDPLLINITGSWLPWHGDLIYPNTYDSVLEESAFYNVDESFLCALEIYKNTKLNTILNDEMNFYYIRNYFDGIATYTNDTKEDQYYFGKIVEPGKSIFVGVEKTPEQQKPCRVTRGAGLYLASYGITGRSEPSAYHHLIADKIICSKVNWFEGKNISDNYVITKYKKPTGNVNFDKCIDITNSKNTTNCSLCSEKKKEVTNICNKCYSDYSSDDPSNENYKFAKNYSHSCAPYDGYKYFDDFKVLWSDKTCKEAKEMLGKCIHCPEFGGNGRIVNFLPEYSYCEYVVKDESRGLCYSTYYSDSEKENKLSNAIYDCKEYNELDYTYADFKKNYFDISYHNQNLESNTNNILIEDEYQITFNIAQYEKDLIQNNIKNYGYIIASSIEKFMNACYVIEEDFTTGVKKRKTSSYFQYGPKQLYKITNSTYNEPYGYGEKIKMVILDKLYLDNSGFYKIDILSGINLDDYGGIGQKLEEIEYFLLGTPRPGQENDRDDGIVAEIFNNLISSEFGTVVRILMAIFVVFWGYRVIFLKRTPIPGKNESEDLIDRKELLIFIIKLSILITLISPNGFSLFSKIVINFFVNGTIGLIDLVSNVFDNGFAPSDTSLGAGLQYVDSSLSLSSNFALIDEITAFFAGDTLTIKVMSFFYNFSDYFFLGIFISIALMLLLVYYFVKVLSTVIPFVFLLLQLTLLLPLAPFFLLLSFFKHTNNFFKSWINSIIGKCLEMFSFFTAFYFFTSLVNNIIKELLNFKVCFVLLGDYWIGTEDVNIVLEGIRKLLNNFVVAVHTGLPDNFFFSYCINMLIAFCLIFMFGSIINSIMGIISSIIEINGQNAGSYMSKDIDKGIDGQLTSIVKDSGLSTVQDFKPMSWTRNLVDLRGSGNDGIIFGSAKKIGKVVGKSGAGFAQSLFGVGREKDESYRERWARWARDTRDLYFGEKSLEKNTEDNMDENLLNALSGGYFEDYYKLNPKEQAGKPRNFKQENSLEDYRKKSEKSVKETNYFADLTKDDDDKIKIVKVSKESFRNSLVNNAISNGEYNRDFDNKLRDTFSTNNKVFFKGKNNTYNYDNINSTVIALNNKLENLKNIKDAIETGNNRLKSVDQSGNITYLSEHDSREIINSLIAAYEAELSNYSSKVQLLMGAGEIADEESIKDFIEYSEKASQYSKSNNVDTGTNETLIGGDATSLLTADGTQLLSQKATDLLNQGNQILFDSSNR